jgi:hypothetical protein
MAISEQVETMRHKAGDLKNSYEDARKESRRKFEHVWTKQERTRPSG